MNAQELKTVFESMTVEQRRAVEIVANRYVEDESPAFEEICKFVLDAYLLPSSIDSVHNETQNKLSDASNLPPLIMATRLRTTNAGVTTLINYLDKLLKTQ